MNIKGFIDFKLDLLDKKLRCISNKYIYNLNGIAVVVSPHEDDESIAMGGTIAKLVKEGFTVFVIYISSEKFLFFNAVNSYRRKQESINALTELGIYKNSIRFLNLPDGKLRRTTISFSKTAGKLKSIVYYLAKGDISGTLILTTARSDGHRDHEDTFNMIKNGLRRCFILEYPTVNHIYSSFEYNCIIDISDYSIKKQRALQHYHGEIKKGRILWQHIDDLELNSGALIGVQKAEMCFISWYGYMVK